MRVAISHKIKMALTGGRSSLPLRHTDRKAQPMALDLLAGAHYCKIPQSTPAIGSAAALCRVGDGPLDGDGPLLRSDRREGALV